MNPRDFLPIVCTVLLVAVVALVAQQWIPAAADTPPDTSWPVVSRVVQPEDLDRC